jgi:hypothetical protein
VYCNNLFDLPRDLSALVIPRRVVDLDTVFRLLGMNIKSLSFALLFLVALTQAHEHSHEPDSEDEAPGQYAQRHVRVFHISCVVPF